MSGHQTHRQTGATGLDGGLGALGTTGAAGAQDPLGAPGSTGASVTTPGAPGVGYDPTEYGTTGGAQAQLHRPGSDPDVGTGQGYTYGTAGGMGNTGAGYHAGVHVPHTTGITGTYDTTFTGAGGDFDASGGAGGGRGGYGAGDIGRGGVGGGAADIGERAHGYGGERGGHHGRSTAEEMADLLSTGVGGGSLGGGDTGRKDDRTHGAGGGKGGYDTGGARKKEGQHRGI